MKNVDTLLIKVAVSFNASWWKTMKSVVLPNALPMIFAGLRLAAGTSLLLLVAAEMIAAQVGIGALILHYGDLMITDRLMAGVIVLSLLDSSSTCSSNGWSARLCLGKIKLACKTKSRTCSSKSWFCLFFMAEMVGFEPTGPVKG